MILNSAGYALSAGVILGGPLGFLRWYWKLTKPTWPEDMIKAIGTSIAACVAIPIGIWLVPDIDIAGLMVTVSTIYAGASGTNTASEKAANSVGFMKNIVSNSSSGNDQSSS